MSESKSSSGGVSFAGLLTIAFVVLKLCKVIDWSWWWVISPIWGQVAFALACVPVRVVYKLWKAKDECRRNEAGYNSHSWENGGRSKWQQRMKEMQQKQKADVN